MAQGSLICLLNLRAHPPHGKLLSMPALPGGDMSAQRRIVQEHTQAACQMRRVERIETTG